MAGEGEDRFDAIHKPKGRICPAVGQQCVDTMHLVDRVEPIEVIVVGLITGMHHSGAIGRAQAAAVIDDSLALMTGEDGDLQAAHG
jgi:hypothetical protein